MVAATDISDVLIAVAQFTVPAVAAVFAAIFAKKAAERVKPNGHGTLPQVTDRIYDHQLELAKQLHEHTVLDTERFDALQQQLDRIVGRNEAVNR